VTPVDFEPGFKQIDACHGLFGQLAAFLISLSTCGRASLKVISRETVVSLGSGVAGWLSAGLAKPQAALCLGRSSSSETAVCDNPEMQRMYL
jgi:hypothetical protein